MTEIRALSELINVYLMALALAIPRGYAMFSFLPVTTRLGLPELLRATVVIALTLPILQPLTVELKKVESITPYFLVLLCFKEVLVGTILGIVLGVPFWAFETSGNIIDFVRQAPDAQLQDPEGATESSISGTLLSLLAVFTFLAAGGLTIIVDIIYASYDAWPIFKLLPEIKPNAAAEFVAVLDRILKTAFVLASPILLIVVMAFFILIVIARFVPQINVFDMSMSFRNIAFFISAPIYLTYVIDYLMPEFSVTKTVVEATRRLLHE